MATIITNKGRLINDLPLANTINDSDTLIIQTSNDSTNRTERVYFGTLKSAISNIEENLSNYETAASFTSGQNKFTGSFWSPDDSTSNFGNIKVRNSFELLSPLTLNNNLVINGGNLSISSGGITSAGNVICNSNLQTNNLGVTGTSTFTGTVYTDTISNNFDIDTDNVNARINVNSVFISASNYLIGNTIVGNNIFSRGIISGSKLSGSLISKNAKATGSFYGYFGGTEAKITTIYTDDIFINNQVTVNDQVTATVFYATVDGFVGNLRGNVEDPSTLNTCLTTDGSIPGSITTNARFFGTASYCLKSEQTDVVTTATTAITAETASYLAYTPGIGNGTASYSVFAESSTSSSYAVTSSYSAESSHANNSNYANSIYMFTSSFLLASSKDFDPTGWLYDLPSLSYNSSPLSTPPGAPSGVPYTGSWVGDLDVNIKPYLTTASVITGITPKYMVVRAELIGKAKTPDGSTPNYVITEPHYVKLMLVPNEKENQVYHPFSYWTGSLKRQITLPFLRNNSIPMCFSDSNTFIMPVPKVSGSTQYLFWSAFVSSSSGRESTAKANAQFSWSYNIYLDGVL